LYRKLSLMAKKKNKFENAINLTKHLRLVKGLKALEKDHSKKIIFLKEEQIFSVFLDECLAKTDPNGSRWDYIIGYKDEAIFVEVHSAKTDEVATVIKKLNWLKLWLINDGIEVNKIKAKHCFHWLQSSKFDLIKNSKQYRLASQNGILPKPKLVLET
jgi:hypothetical protein